MRLVGGHWSKGWVRTVLKKIYRLQLETFLILGEIVKWRKTYYRVKTKKKAACSVYVPLDTKFIKTIKTNIEDKRNFKEKTF